MSSLLLAPPTDYDAGLLSGIDGALELLLLTLEVAPPRLDEDIAAIESLFLSSFECSINWWCSLLVFFCDSSLLILSVLIEFRLRLLMIVFHFVRVADFEYIFKIQVFSNFNISFNYLKYMC